MDAYDPSNHNMIFQGNPNEQQPNLTIAMTFEQAYQAVPFNYDGSSLYHQQQARFQEELPTSFEQAFAPARYPVQPVSAAPFLPDNATFHQHFTSTAVRDDSLAAVPLRPQVAFPSQFAQGDGRKLSMDSATSAMRSPSTAQPSPRSRGPMSREVKIPARPKPGRKPMPPGVASDRRRTQNRMAQRSFRDKRQQKVCELGTALVATQTKLHQEEAEMERTKIRAVEQMRMVQEQHHTEKEELLAQIESLKQQLSSRGYPMDGHEQPQQGMQDHLDALQRFPGPRLAAISAQTVEKPQEVAIPTPPEDNWNEIDMTEAWMRSKSSTYDQSDSSNWMDYDMDADPTNGSGCGFCTDDSNCACKASVSTVPKQNTSGPGTCARCQSDPTMAAACRSLADKTLPPVDNTAEPSTKTMSCGQFIDKLKAQTRMPSIAELFGPLHAFPARNGFNVDEQEAAKALQDMSTMSPPARH